MGPSEVKPEGVAFLNSKWKPPHTCPICHKSAWQIEKQVFQLTPYYSGPTVVIGGGPVIPVMVAVCANCGNFQFFSAFLTGAAGREPGPGNVTDG